MTKNKAVYGIPSPIGSWVSVKDYKKAKERIAQLENQIKELEDTFEVSCDTIYQAGGCKIGVKAKQDGAKAERERILKRLDDADCQCCGDTERIKVELMK